MSMIGWNAVWMLPIAKALLQHVSELTQTDPIVGEHVGNDGFTNVDRQEWEGDTYYIVSRLIDKEMFIRVLDANGEIQHQAHESMAALEIFWYWCNTERNA